MKLDKIRTINDEGKELIYVGHFEGERLDKMREIAVAKGIEKDFYSMPLLTDHYYAEEETIDNFNI